MGNQIVLVVTQPDREKGRGKELAMSPVKECALKHGIEVFQPLKIREEESVNYLRRYDADICVVAAFGQIVSVDFSDVLLSETLSSDGILLSDEEDEEDSSRLRLLPPDFSLPQPTAENVRTKAAKTAETRFKLPIIITILQYIFI